MPPEGGEDGLRQSRLHAVERVTKSTVLGSLLLPFLAVVSNPSVCTLQMANTLQRKFTSLAQLAAQVGVMCLSCDSHVMCGHHDEFSLSVRVHRLLMVPQQQL